MKGKIVRATAGEGNIRIVAVNATKLVDKARILHNTFPTATAAFGRVLIGALLIGAGLKSQETVTLRIDGDGPLGTVVAVSNNEGNVKGYISNPQVYLEPDQNGKMNIAKAIGQGMLYVIKDLKLKGVYTGSSPLISGEIGEDLTHYFYTSEQIPTAIGMGVLVDKDTSVIGAGGYLVQLMPGAPEDIINHLEQRVKELGSVSSFIEKGKESIDIVNYLCEPWDVTVHEKKEIDFKCGCNDEKIEKILISLGEEEIKDIIKTQKEAELICHFCNKKYLLNEDKLLKLLDEAKDQ